MNALNSFHHIVLAGACYHFEWDSVKITTPIAHIMLSVTGESLGPSGFRDKEDSAPTF